MKTLAQVPDTPSAGADERAIVAVEQSQRSNAAMADLRAKVKLYFEIDDNIRRLRAATTEQQTAQKALAGEISDFMSANGIEDLNTKEGRLRCKMHKVRAPVTHTQMKKRMAEYFGGDASKAEDMYSTIFEKERSELEKVGLYRIKIS